MTCVPTRLCIVRSVSPPASLELEQVSRVPRTGFEHPRHGPLRGVDGGVVRGHQGGKRESLPMEALPGSEGEAKAALDALAITLTTLLRPGGLWTIEGGNEWKGDPLATGGGN